MAQCTPTMQKILGQHKLVSMASVLKPEPPKGSTKQLAPWKVKLLEVLCPWKRSRGQQAEVHNLSTTAETVTTKDNALYVPMHIRTKQGTQILPMLLDTGAPQNILSEAAAKQMGLTWKTMESPITIGNVNRSNCGTGVIDQYCDIPLKLDNTWKEEHFHRANIGSNQVILGMSWLLNFDPTIDWTKGTIQEVLEVPLHLNAYDILPGPESTVPIKGSGQGKVVSWGDKNKVTLPKQEEQNMPKQLKGLLKEAPEQLFRHNPLPHLREALETSLKENQLDQSTKNLDALRKPLMEQEATKVTDLDALFDAVMDQEGSKNTLESQIEVIPEPNEEISITNAEEPQIEEALQTKSGHMFRPEGADNVKRSKSPPGGTCALQRLDGPTEPTCGIEEIPNYKSNMVDKLVTHEPEWPHLPQKVIDLLKIASGGGPVMPKAPNIPPKDREMNVQMPEIAY